MGSLLPQQDNISKNLSQPHISLCSLLGFVVPQSPSCSLTAYLIFVFALCLPSQKRDPRGQGILSLLHPQILGQCLAQAGESCYTANAVSDSMSPPETPQLLQEREQSNNKNCNSNNSYNINSNGLWVSTCVLGTHTPYF